MDLEHVACCEQSVLLWSCRGVTDRSGVLDSRMKSQSDRKNRKREKEERRHTGQNRTNRNEISAAAMQEEWQEVVQRDDLYAETSLSPALSASRFTDRSPSVTASLSSWPCITTTWPPHIMPIARLHFIQSHSHCHKLHGTD